MAEFTVGSPEEKRLREELFKREDIEAVRLKRFLGMPDLSRLEGNPVKELVSRIIALPDFKDFDVVHVPEIVSAKESFDPFNFPLDHPARSRSDTYYVDEEHILRTHTTVMWSYYLNLPEVKEKIKNGVSTGVFAYGKVYRKDEIDRHHMPVFHQIDGLYLCKREEKEIGIHDLQEVLASIAKAIFGNDIKYRFNKDKFPYTDPSLEMEIDLNGAWVEVLGAGVVESKVLDNFGVDSKIWNGWAFGFGIERLAILSMQLPDIRLLWSNDQRVKRQLKLGTVYKEVSKYPPIVRDISFIVKNDFVPNYYFEVIRDIGGDLIEEVALMDKYENAEKFGEGKISYTYRVIYRSNERTLTVEEIEPLQNKIIEETKEQFGAEIR
jgi:phenylalanyl-tRNA synthetase alpha chain